MSSASSPRFDGAPVSESTVRALLDELPHGVVVHRLGRIVYVNQVLVTLVGYTRADELIGTPALDLMHPDDRGAVVARVQEAMRTGQRVMPREERFLRRDGTSFVAEVSATPLSFEGGPAIVAMVRDISERLEMQRKLLLADRMASLGTLAAGVAHEINTPLSYILHNLSFVREHLEDAKRNPDTWREVLSAVADAEEGGQRVRKIVRALNVFARPESESSGAVDVQRPVRSAIQMVRGEIRRRARLVEDFAEVPPIRGDELRIAQVMVNLLVNAAHAIAEGAPERNEVKVRVGLAPDGRVLLEVTDTGTGIPPEIQGRMFDPFFTTKPQGEGSGLGLAICHGIVSGLGGEIVIESELAKGSTFRVLLPPAPAQGAADDRGPLGGIPARRGRVLIVDDQARFGESLARLLEREHSVTVLTCAREARDRVLAGEQYELIFCDLMMPEMSGMEFYEELTGHTPEQAARIVFLTGGAFSEQAREFLAKIPNRHLAKPLDMAALGWLLLEAMGPAA